MQPTILNTPLLFAAATAVAATGYLTGPAPAQAAPEACSQYAFNGDFVISGANTGQVIVSDVLPGTRFAGRTFTESDDGRAVRGFIQDGAIQGRNINFKISWIEESDTTWTFNGTVSDDGLVHGGIMHGPGFMGLWDSTTPLACNDPEIATKPLPGNIVTPPAPATTRVPGPVTAP
jgi:hypothetical protein